MISALRLFVGLQAAAVYLLATWAEAVRDAWRWPRAPVPPARDDGSRFEVCRVSMGSGRVTHIPGSTHPSYADTVPELPL